ncbi:MAG TPA: hypothetical protein VMI54_15490 [Polyangiaceae bacterium]|nr:hypothetical protein [Polyangiaceae bacterium]
MVDFGESSDSTQGEAPLAALARRVLFALPVFVLLGLGVRSMPAPGLREDEVQCEEALARIQSCCRPLYASNLACVYVDHGDCNPPTLPDLSVDESHVVEQASCSDISAAGYCTEWFAHEPPEDDEDD